MSASVVVPFKRKRTDNVKALTPLALRTLRFIEGHRLQHGGWPSLEQIGKAAGINTETGTWRVLRQLFEAKAITQPKELSRN